MSIFRRWSHQWLVVLSVCLLAACGGGGGGGAEVIPPPATAPSITSQPSDAQVVAGGEARFQASAQGTAVAWTWQRSNDSGTTWVTVANAGTASPDNSTAFLNLSAVTLADNNARFRAVATSSGLLTLSSAATLTVSVQVTAPAISVQLSPQQQAVTGSTVTLAITAVGTDLQYQWQSSRSATAWADVPAATTPTLVLPALSADANGTQYRVVVRNSAGSVTSDAVTLSVTAPAAAPAFTLQPLAAAVTAPDTATFTVTATGQPAPALQWQRSSNGGANYADIPGATAASYTPPATTLADTGALFRAVASSSAGTATSQAATLTVGAALSTPVIATHPLDVTVAAAQTATFAVGASGVPTPGYQWQMSTDAGVSFANINGATGSSHSLVVAQADNGKRYRAVVSNSQGTDVSRAALLVVTVPVSTVLGRTWAVAQSLEENATTRSVTDSDAAIDDRGRVTVVFRKSDGTRSVIYAMHGSPNGAGVAATWTTPVAIDLLAGNGPVSNMPSARLVSVTAAPGGNAVALWNHMATCTAGTYLGAGGPFLCNYFYFARYTASTGQWAQPELLTDIDIGSFQVLLNDRGDLVFYGDTWIATPLIRLNRVKGLFMRTASETAFRRQLLSDVPTTAFQKVQPHLDAAGNLLLVAEYRPAGVSTIVAFRGTVGAGLTQETVLEPRNSRLDKSRMGLNGQQVATWTLADESLALYAATSATATAPFAVALALAGSLSAESLTIDDDGQALLQGVSVAGRVRWTASGGWLPIEEAGSSISFLDLGRNGNATISRSGDVLQVDSSGLTVVRDQASRTRFPAIGAPPEYLLGFQAGVVQFGSRILLSNSGVGFVLMQNSCAVLPTPLATQCVSQLANALPVTSLWGAFRK